LFKIKKKRKKETRNCKWLRQYNSEIYLGGDEGPLIFRTPHHDRKGRKGLVNSARYISRA